MRTNKKKENVFSNLWTLRHNFENVSVSRVYHLTLNHADDYGSTQMGSVFSYSIVHTMWEGVCMSEGKWRGSGEKGQGQGCSCMHSYTFLLCAKVLRDKSVVSIHLSFKLFHTQRIMDCQKGWYMEENWERRGKNVFVPTKKKSLSSKFYSLNLQRYTIGFMDPDSLVFSFYFRIVSLFLWNAYRRTHFVSFICFFFDKT